MDNYRLLKPLKKDFFLQIEIKGEDLGAAEGQRLLNDEGKSQVNLHHHGLCESRITALCCVKRMNRESLLMIH